MRVIVFRGKRLDNGRWAYGSLLVLAERCFIVPNEEIPDCEKPNAVYWAIVRQTCEVDPETVGRYTGMTDKNGRRIFEGDIILNQHNVVEWCDGGFCLNGDRPLSDGWCNKVEVLGNIHAMRSEPINKED